MRFGFWSVDPTALRRALLVVMTLLTVLVTYVAGERLGMLRMLSTRHAYYSLPYAVSHRYFGTRGYVILRDVAEVFIKAHPYVTNATLQQATMLEPSPDRVMFFPADDKGDADFAILALRVFGVRVESLYYLWFALYLVGVLAFAAAFWRSQARLTALLLTTLAVYAALYALPLTFELGSIDNPRVFGAVSLVAIFHLSFAMIDRQPLTAVNLLAVAVQCALITLSIDVRTTEWWQVMTIAGVGIFLLSWAGPFRPGNNGGLERTAPRLKVVWPCAVLGVALVAFTISQYMAVDDVYGRSHIRGRIFWHNVGTGFALNPVLAQKYSLAIDDMPMIRLVRQRLVQTNRAGDIDVVFRPAGQEDYQYSGIAKDFVRYERIAREVVLSIAWNDKYETLRTFLVDKPRLLMMQLAWAAGYQGYSIDDLYLAGQIGALVDERKRPEQSIYLNPFRPWILAGVVVALLLVGSVGARSAEYQEMALLSLWTTVVSLLPAMIAYPIISAIGLVLVTVPLLILALGVWLVAAAVAISARRTVSSRSIVRTV